jgi:AcrR family transcriptional regulator
MSKREEILNTTLDLVCEIGFHDTSIPLIIKKSGVASGTIYHHFKNKEALINTLFAELNKEMGKAIIRDIETDTNYKVKFFHIWNNLVTFYIENPKKFEFLEDYTNSPRIKNEIKVIHERHYQAAIDFLESGIKSGILRELPVQLIKNITFGNVSTFTRMILLNEIEYSDELLEKTIQSSWDSVKIN